MKTKSINVSIIPANPKHFMIYNNDHEKEYFVCEEIIAWRIKTYEKINDELFSTSSPIISTGEPASNAVGICNLEGTIEMFSGEIFHSLRELNETYYPKKEK